MTDQRHERRTPAPALHCRDSGERHEADVGPVQARHAEQHVEDRDAGRGLPARLGEVAMHAPRGPPQPAHHQHLHVHEVRQPVGQKRRDGRSDDAARARSGKIAAEHVGARRDHRKRQPRGDVVQEHGVARQPVDGRQRHADAEQRLDVAQRVGIREENGSAPQAAEAMAGPIGDPAKDPRVVQRVGVADDAAAGIGGQRPREDDGRRKRGQGDEEDVAPVRHNR